jgi:hypothetical protein
MLRTLGIFVGFVVMLGAGVAVAAWPQAKEAAPGFSSDELLVTAFARVSTGMPASQLAAAGLDTAKAKRLSALALMEAFMPKDSTEFDALNPALQSCFQNRDGCDGYVFRAVAAEAVLVVEHGRVSWKMMLGLPVAKLQKARRMASAGNDERTARN